MQKLFLSFALLCASSLSWGAQLGLTATGIAFTTDTSNYTIGWSFNVNAPIVVTALGYFDANGDGLRNPHRVGIFNSAGSLLVSTTVAAGLTDPLVDNWRMASISPFALNPGLYVVASEQAASADPITVSATSITAGPNITVVDPTLFNYGTGLIFPTRSGGTYLQANFLYESPMAVPEPGTAAMFVTVAGVAAAQFIRRRK